MESVYVVRKERGAFDFDFKIENPCKGTIMLEIMPLKADEKLILNGDKNNLISRRNPFKIESHYPITGGQILDFIPESGSKTQTTIVNILFVK